MKYYIIAGEASGDLHAANLIKSIKSKTPDAEFRGWGGDKMANEGCVVTKHYKELAFMGFWEVFTHLDKILRNFSICKKEIIDYQPDAVILVDYPGFNLRMADFAKKHHFKTIYYVSPQVWAWKKGRVKKIKACVDELMVILPFEEKFYAQYDYPVHYVGNPVLDEIVQFNPEHEGVRNFRKNYGLDDRPIVAILPGSRKQEIKSLLPVMSTMVDSFPQYQFVISVVKWQPRELYTNIVQNIPFIEGDTYAMLSNAQAAIVASGTASLETALMNVPQVVCYKCNWISYIIAKNLVKGINYISLANLILDKQVFNELLQKDCNPERLSKELEILLHDEEKIAQMKENYRQLRKILGDGGASDNAAEVVVRAMS